jgi:HK97 family phage major capsid protein
MNLNNTMLAAVRKHAPTFTQNLRASGQDIETLKLHALEWRDLCRVERDAKQASTRTIEKMTDGLANKSAVEIEAAFDGLTAIAVAAASEKDARTACGDQSPRDRVDLSRRPAIEPGSWPAVDGGDDQDENRTAADWALTSEKRMTTHATAKRPDETYRGLSIGNFLKAAIAGASTDSERRALAEGTDSAGGYTVPTSLSAQLIDALRAASVVVQAGARTVPLDTNSVAVAKLLTDPVPAWRNENASVNESDPTFGQVLFEPKSLAVMTKISLELMQDSVNIATELPRILAAALALELDRVALLGSGSAPEPRGIANVSGIGTTALGGAFANYAPLLIARTGILTRNGGMPGAVIMNPRDEGALSGWTDSTGQPLNQPRALDGMKFLTTTSIPTNGGTGTDESTMFVGDFTKLLIGMRQDIRIEILRERYADSLQYALVAHLRADLAVEHAAAFHTITGVQG